jgi:hypothetical protein
LQGLRGIFDVGGGEKFMKFMMCMKIGGGTFRFVGQGVVPARQTPIGFFHFPPRHFAQRLSFGKISFVQAIQKFTKTIDKKSEMV